MLEHPAITKAMREGGNINTNKILDYCYICDLEICEGDTYYNLDSYNICNSYECKLACFNLNADKQLKCFSDDTDMTNEAVEWYFENYATKEGGIR